jgi:hypothetical protein
MEVGDRQHRLAKTQKSRKKEKGMGSATKQNMYIHVGRKSSRLPTTLVRLRCYFNQDSRFAHLWGELRERK